MSATPAFVCFNKRSKDAVAINGHVFHATPDPINDYLNSGSEWFKPEDFEIVDVAVFYEFRPYQPKDPPEVDLTELPSDL